ncbi:hypothetical protein KUM39_11560 [Streptomyces sp. J2-1]|uniref:hypothetical protein n=1 Tax=Streptomyces corallincola TaxID=2851888 RepID=UPI001C38DD18|nr:hypothetical protein [Streptomyces corallincola]MBV2354994.1 hypothetical protein [Streptomyces corallincola]
MGRRNWARGTAGVVLAALVGAGAVACSDDSGDGASGNASKAASAAASLASRGTEALSSATAEAKRKLDSVKGGVDAKKDVSLGTPTTSGDRAAVKVTAKNTADSGKTFAVQVNFRDRSGNLLDVAVVTVKDVAAGATGEATATSNRKLSGDVTATIGSALRY